MVAIKEKEGTSWVKKVKGLVPEAYEYQLGAKR